MSEWRETTLGEVADFQNGYPFKPRELGGEAVPVIRIKQLLDPRAEIDYSDVDVPTKFRIDSGDLIFSWSATLASVLWNRGPALLNQHLFRVSARKGVELHWLHYCLDHAIEALLSKSHGTTMKHVTKKVLLAHAIALPTLDEQRRIVDVVAAVDSQTETLEAEVVESRRTATRMRSHLFACLDCAMVPAGEMFHMLLGRQKSDRQAVGDHVLPYIRSGNVSPGTLALSEVLTMNFEPHEQVKYGLSPGDIMLTEGGTPGQAARWNGEIDGVVGFDKHVIRLRARPETSTSEYALQWCHWSRESGAFDAQATGITIKALGFGRASAMPVPALNVEEQTTLVAPIAALDSQIATLVDELASLRAFRATLLTALLSQSISIPESYDALLDADLSALEGAPA